MQDSTEAEEGVKRWLGDPVDGGVQAVTASIHPARIELATFSVLG